jgi:pSer/pThr/pTyr-binding forkhead associated (FHA) protein
VSRLEVLSPASLRAEPFELWGGAVLVGRGEDADWCLLEPSVSRRHALVRHFADHDEIEDLGSTGGTYVNGRRLSGPVRLRDGDRIHLARVLVRYCLDPDEAGAAAGQAPTGSTVEITPMHPPPPGARQRWWPF